jgi:hypothetical protein
MRNFYLLTAMLFLGVSSFGQKQNVIKANLFSPLVKSGSFFYERAFDTNKSGQLGVGFTAYSTGNTKISGLFITPEFRFYLSDGKNALEGFYVGPFVRYQNLTVEDITHTGKAELNTFGGGVVVGHQWLFKDLISLDIFAGPSYNSGQLKVTDTQDPSTYSVPSTFNGFGLRSGVTLGIAF